MTGQQRRRTFDTPTDQLPDTGYDLPAGTDRISRSCTRVEPAPDVLLGTALLRDEHREQVLDLMYLDRSVYLTRDTRQRIGRHKAEDLIPDLTLWLITPDLIWFGGSSGHRRVLVITLAENQAVAERTPLRKPSDHEFQPGGSCPAFQDGRSK